MKEGVDFLCDQSRIGTTVVWKDNNVVSKMLWLQSMLQRKQSNYKEMGKIFAKTQLKSVKQKSCDESVPSDL